MESRVYPLVDSHDATSLNPARKTISVSDAKIKTTPTDHSTNEVHATVKALRESGSLGESKNLASEDFLVTTPRETKNELSRNFSALFGAISSIRKSTEETKQEPEESESLENLNLRVSADLSLRRYIKVNGPLISQMREERRKREVVFYSAWAEKARVCA